jgi:hypothetical protein
MISSWPLPAAEFVRETALGVHRASGAPWRDRAGDVCPNERCGLFVWLDEGPGGWYRGAAEPRSRRLACSRLVPPSRFGCRARLQHVLERLEAHERHPRLAYECGHFNASCHDDGDEGQLSPAPRWPCATTPSRRSASSRWPRTAAASSRSLSTGAGRRLFSCSRRKLVDLSSGLAALEARRR